MRKGTVVKVGAADRRRLAGIVANRNSPQIVWRARIILLTADGAGTAEIMRQTSKSKSVVWRWQERFMQAGAARQDAPLPQAAAGPGGDHAGG